MGETARYELEGHVATITYNRPAALNAINGEMRRDLNDAFGRFRDDEDAWVAMPYLKSLIEKAHAKGIPVIYTTGVRREDNWDNGSWGWKNSRSKEDNVHKPQTTLVTWCDFVIASERAEFGFPEVRLGVPTIVGAIRLPQRLQWHDAMELLLTGERIDAARAKAIGLVGSVVAHDDLMNEARLLADRLLQGAPLAQRAIKEVAVRSRQLPMLEAIRFGETMRKVAGSTEDAAEGGRAAAEGRSPEWRAR